MTGAFVSTGALPEPDAVQAAVDDAYARYRADTGGAVSTVYPALSRVSRDCFGICIVGSEGRVYTAGDADAEFTIMSVSKPFAFALACEKLGAARARQAVGVGVAARGAVAFRRARTRARRGGLRVRARLAGGRRSRGIAASRTRSCVRAATEDGT